MTLCSLTNSLKCICGVVKSIDNNLMWCARCNVISSGALTLMDVNKCVCSGASSPSEGFPCAKSLFSAEEKPLTYTVTPSHPNPSTHSRRRHHGVIQVYELQLCVKHFFKFVSFRTKIQPVFMKALYECRSWRLLLVITVVCLYVAGGAHKRSYHKGKHIIISQEKVPHRNSMFSWEELVTSSLSGKHFSGLKYKEPKSQLCPTKVKAICGEL